MEDLYSHGSAKEEDFAPEAASAQSPLESSPVFSRQLHQLRR